MDGHERRNASNRANDDLDRVLDATLARYATVEPRAGLEERVLANLRSQAARPAWWKWGVATLAFAAVIIVAALVLRPGRSKSQVIVRQPSSSVPSQPQSQPRVAHRDHHPEPPRKHRHENNGIDQAQQAKVAAAPKLDQFPSRQPLSAEEIALAQYVENFPKEARLVAEAQEQFALETQKVMNDFGSENRPSGSTLQER